MADYGIKVSRDGTSAFDAVGSQVIMTTKYPFAKIDPTKTDTFRTTTVTFLTDAPNNVKTIIAQFAHGYNYIPQIWGLWNITWSPSIPSDTTTQNGYGTVLSSTGVAPTIFEYSADTTNVYLYITKGYTGFQNSVGTVATLTSYVFVDDTTTM